MNIFVCVKQVPDTETKVKPNGDGSYIDKTGIKWVMNPYDEFAVEQSILIKAANPNAKVTAIRVGEKSETEVLRTALAMGVDDGILVDTNENLDSHLVAMSLFKSIEKSGVKPDLILTGKQAVDDDCLQVPQLLAEFLGVPHVSVIVKFEMVGTTIKVKREVEGGALELYEMQTPVVLTCNKSLNTPRYPSLPGIIKAKKKPLTTYTLADLGLKKEDIRVQYKNFQLPPAKPAGKKFDALDDSKQRDVVKNVIGLLRTEAKVI